MSVLGMSDAIGPGFFTPEQAEWRSTRRRIGGVDDPNVGSYHLSRIHWNKETGTGSFSTTDPAPDGWIDQGDCGCGGTPDPGGCSCH